MWRGRRESLLGPEGFKKLPSFQILFEKELNELECGLWAWRTTALNPSGEVGWAQGLGAGSLASLQAPSPFSPEPGSRKDLQQPRCVCDQSLATSITLL